ncbi:MAG TPA: ABC transporter permease [Mycobacteriales bacterium]|nr:ABC transporter permease [Mycobacteriales bacterium]
MTATAVHSTTRPARRVSFDRVLHSEWIKFRSVRSSWLTLAITMLLVIGLGTLFTAARASRWPPRDPGELLTFDPTRISLAGVFLAQLAVGVLGVLVVTAEYSTGTIRATFTAAPRRLAVYLAKPLLFAALSLIALVPTAFAAFALGQHMLSSKHIQTTLSAPGVTRAVIGAALYLAVVGLFGVALGWLLRHTAGAISTLFGVLLILPLLAHVLPSPWDSDVNKWLPSGAGQAVFAVRADPSTFAPWTGFGVFCMYVAACLVLGAVTVLRRDA